MSTAEFAEFRAGDDPYRVSPAHRLILARRGALLIYATAFVTAALTWGVPLQTQLVIAWTCGALACASIGRPRREIVQLALDWAPLAAILSVYDLSRGVVDSLGIGVHYAEMANIDRWLFGGTVPTEWLQRQLLDLNATHWWDTVFTAVYSSHFIAWLALAGLLWNRSRDAFLGFTKRLVTLGFIGLATYVAFPAAPPWLAAREGTVDDVVRSSARGWEALDLGTAQLFERGQAVVNQTAAVPSLHAAFAALIAMFLWPRVRVGWRPLLVAYPLAMGFVLVTTGEHYVFDILLGWVYAGGVMTGWTWWERRDAPNVSPQARATPSHPA